MDFRQLQVEVYEWSVQNFPMNQAHYPLLGLVEEVGELAHAHLKREQGIRGSSMEHSLAKFDAVGDIVIYLADYCARNLIDLQAAVEETWAKVRQRDWQANRQTGLTDG